MVAANAHALSVVHFSPQGEVSKVHQVVVRFDAAAIRFGDAAFSLAPLQIECDSAAAFKGQGRWTSEKEWIYDFQDDLPPGVRCKATPSPDFKPFAGAPLPASRYEFNTGGPFVQQTWPNYHRIEEEQSFVLKLNGTAQVDTVVPNVWCAADGVGERIPVTLADAPARTAALVALGLDKAAAKEPLRYVVLSCNRRFAASAHVQLVYGKGVATPSGIANRVERRFDFQVRDPFTAELHCERESAQSACIPIQPMTLHFSSPITRGQALAARLRSASAEYKPVIGSEDGEDGGEYEDSDALVSEIRFPAPLPENTAFTITLPAGLKDASDRPLANAASFPLKTATGTMPPLAKFASAPFGIIERFAEGPDGPALLPVTLRNVERQLQASAVAVSDLSPQSDAEIIAWLNRTHLMEEPLIERTKAATLVRGPLPPAIDNDDKEWMQPRTVSLLAGQSGVEKLNIAPPTDGGKGGGDAAGAQLRPFEVVGIPLKPGFHVVELASTRLGQSMLDTRHGANRTMYVRTTALVTNLAVHFKLGRENALAWVTTLDKGQPVPDAVVRVSDCKGRGLATARTNAQGVAHFTTGIPSEVPRCWNETDAYNFGYFISARATIQGVPDMAFTWSDWKKGLESWRFNLPTGHWGDPEVRVHTVFDRNLLRAGETVSMKHLIRTEVGTQRHSLALPAANPAEVVIRHVGSGKEYKQPLVWRATATGGRSAETEFEIPKTAELGIYHVSLKASDEDVYHSGSFRVEEFRLPVFKGLVGPESKEALIAPGSVPVRVQVDYLSGGPAAGLPVQVSATLRVRVPSFADYEKFSFRAPSPHTGDTAAGEDIRVVADKLPVTLNREGTGRAVIEHLQTAVVPATVQAQTLSVEASYADPNGEIQTVRSSSTLWPAAVVAGIAVEGWASVDRDLKFQALALDLQGQPAPGVALEVKAISRTYTTTRKRMVGGFYTYDDHTETKALGTVCSGKSDAHGLLACSVTLTKSGEIELIATARDVSGRQSQAADSVWVTRQSELWFGGEDSDRMDVLPEKKSYQPGETARLQVRMPFRQATALVSVEREGIVQTQVLQLRGDDPVIKVKIEPNWSPNVYISVLALRGRLYEVPWYSFFTWGYKTPRAWWRAFWGDSKDYVPATALVDLSKPAFRFGVAEIRVDDAAHRLGVQVTPERTSYAVREQAQVNIQVTLPGGQPAAHAEVALAAVDQALLELMPNPSWNLLQAMLQQRPWGVETATAQSEIVGRRHWGRKAVPAGGDGGGQSATRELLDTLLLWNPRVQLDARGQASVRVPLNDSLGAFRIVAVADSGTSLFGTGDATITVTQDLQLISGLPPLVREGDRFRAQFTVRNTTDKAMKITLAARATLLDLPAQTLDMAAGEAKEVFWEVTAPEQPAHTRAQALLWEVSAKDSVSGARDALKISQRIIAAVPLTVQQATLVQLQEAAPYTLQAAPPATALALNGAARGGLSLAFKPRLGDGLPGVQDWFSSYPHSCLEQRASRAIGLQDADGWARLTAQLPTYLDADGLANYFPFSAGSASSGSDTLTAYLLAATHEAALADSRFALPEAERASMLAGLAKFVEGRIERKHWSPQPDLDLRKLAAIEALARHGTARAAMLDSLGIAPNQWPTSALLDWISILQRVEGIPDQARQLEQAQQILRARLNWQGTRALFSTEAQDALWWLMVSNDSNMARTLLLASADPDWRDDLGRLVTGLIARQKSGAWNTTVANLWGTLALARFSREHESAPVSGQTRIEFGGVKTSVQWPADSGAPTAAASGAAAAASAPTPASSAPVLLPWPGANAAKANATLEVAHQGSGKPWFTLQSLAAVPVTQPLSAGYRISKTIAPVDAATATPRPPGQYQRGDILRVTLEITSSADMTWVAVTDPIPAGATILGSGLGRDSQLATTGEQTGGAWPVYTERAFDAYRAYYAHMPRGKHMFQYTVRLNNPGLFHMPASRVETMYAPEMFGVAPNAAITVRAD
ncbi:MAG: alpha-2-macroglobulin [Burkholderiaceae bacterium]|nr:alpha-2-macroglobulin [Burkholderiaceae bacterium]